MDGRRHSVDIPISRTLIALRRVRSLRDPSTNSMSKLSTLIDNVKWETNSSNGISLRFVNDCPQAAGDDNSLQGAEHLEFHKQREQKGDDFRLHRVMENPNSQLIKFESFCPEENNVDPVRTKQFEGLNQEEIQSKRPSSERNNPDSKDNEVMTLASNPMEDVDSCNGPIGQSSPIGRAYRSASKRKYVYKNQAKLYGVMGDVESHVGSPSPSNRTSWFMDEEVDIVDSNYRGCGISYCWSRTPRLRESNPSSDVDDLPLLSSGDTGETTLCGQSCWKRISNEITPYSETPRSLSQKFRPKSFDELVGQYVVVRSLLTAIAKRRISSLYLFHGPRGTGKTSASRIFAAALNCLSLDERKPCGLCRECIFYFSGRSRNVKEVDSLRINRTERVRSLIKNAAVPPVSSRFKVFIIDECQLLLGETWAAVLNSLENLSQQVVFVMVTPELDKLPRSAVSRSQKYHFPKIKDADISNRLEKICVEEGLDFDQVALDFIAAKSNGSLRDAEIMLDQLSLLGKKVTMSLAYELIGTVSDDELLDLLDLALSSDTSNTVIRARELMRSKIDPLQLISQLANLIMDILAGKCGEGSTEAIRKFSKRHTSEVELQKLRHALRILSETEKHLRVSKNQTTWLTAALLQLSSVESNSSDSNDSKVCFSNVCDKEGESHSTASAGERSKQLIACSCNGNTSHKLGMLEDCNGKLESIWRRAIELGQSSSLKKFLRKQGKLSSLCFNQGLAVAELEFRHPNHVSRAERSWKLIASSLQLAVGCNVELRINLAIHNAVPKGAKVKKRSFGLFSCSRRMLQKSESSTENGTDSDSTSENPMIRARRISTCSSDCGSEVPHSCHHGREVVKALRNSEGNVLSTGTTSSRRLLQEDTSSTPGCGVDSSKGEGRDCKYHGLSFQEPDNQPNCFPRALRFQKKHMCDTSKMISMCKQKENKLALSVPRMTSFEKSLCSSDAHVFCCSNDLTNSSIDGDSLRENSDVFCWRTPTFPVKKAWQLTHQGRRSYIVEKVLPCTTGQ